MNDWASAHAHRERLDRVAMIAVTGSCGKTTTKDLIARVLGGRWRGRTSSGSNNCGADLPADLLTVSPDDHFFVQELAAWGPGTIEPGLDLIRPRIGVVTNLRNDHYSSFHGPRGAQAEKGKLVAGLPASGGAVLNWDDPLVRELGERTAARVFSFGRSEHAELRVVDVQARWPQRLSFTLVHRGRRVPVRTRLLGEHLLGSALAAIAVGLMLDVPLDTVVTALAEAEPTPRRMSVVTHPDGVTFVRDDFKAPADSLPEVLHFMSEANASRKLGVFGRISDFPGRSRRTYADAACRAAAVLDEVLFVGERAWQLWREGAPVPSVRVFETVAEAADYLTDRLRAGDLVLLKGSGPTDHLERVMLARERDVSCWLPDCGRVTGCEDCGLLASPGRAVRGVRG